MTGALKESSNTDNLTVAEKGNVDWFITAEASDGNDMKIDLKDKQNTEAYEEKMRIDIENINTIE